MKRSYLLEVTCRLTFYRNESVLSSLVRSALAPILPDQVSKAARNAGEAGVAV